MGTKLTNIALVVVFGLIVLLGTFLLFQAWYNNVAPTDAEIQAVVVRATKMNVDEELAELMGPYNASQNIEMAGQVLLIIEGLLMAIMLIYLLIKPVDEMGEQEEEQVGATFERAYEGY